MSRFRSSVDLFWFVLISRCLSRGSSSMGMEKVMMEDFLFFVLFVMLVSFFCIF